MKLFNRNQTTNFDEDTNPLELSAYRQERQPEQQEQQDTDHPNQYYCGICGWVDINLFPYCH